MLVQSLTIHSSRTRFADRHNSGVRPYMENSVQRTVTIFSIFLLFSPFVSAAQVSCEDLEERAGSQSVQIMPRMSFTVIGKGRLHLHSAPSASCQTEVFVVTNDSLIGYQEFERWTYVMYIHPITGQDSSGWVVSKRLKVGGSMSPLTAPTG